MPQPNVLTDEAQPNVLSTQATGRAPGTTSWAGTSDRAVAPNQVLPARRPVGAQSVRAQAIADSRFEPRARRGPSLTSVIVIGFLLVTAFRVIGALAGPFFSGQPAQSVPPITIGGALLEAGSIAFGISSDNQCGLDHVQSTFHPGADVSWSAHLARSLTSGEVSVEVIVIRNGVEIERSTVLRRDLGARGTDVVCSIRARSDNVIGSYVIQLRDASGSRVLASGKYSLSP